MPVDKRYRLLDDQFGIEDVGSTLLDHLAKGLYPADEVLREYIQNAIDAHRLWEHENHSKPDGPIQVEIRGDRLSILDYGIGMAEFEVRRVKSIAVTSKIDSEVLLTGHKGVGIWAGLSYFETLILETTRRGSKLGYRLTIHFKRIVKSIDYQADIGKVMKDNYFIEVYDAEEEEHYTSVTLERPTRSSDWFTEADKIKDAIQRICPCEIDPNFVFQDRVMEWYEQHSIEVFKILVDGMPVYRSYPSAVENFKTLSITVNDAVVAEYWHAIHKTNGRLIPTSDELTGFRIIQNGFTLGGDNLYSDVKLSDFKLLNQSNEQYLAWHIGEIHITSRKLRPNLQRNQLEESDVSHQFIQRLRDFYGRIEEQGRQLGDKRRVAAKLEKDIQFTLAKYTKDEEIINAILGRQVLVSFTQGDITILTEILHDLTVDDQLAESSTEAKKNAHLKDANIKRLRKKLNEKIKTLLAQAQKPERKTERASNDSSSKLQDELTSVPSLNNNETYITSHVEEVVEYPVPTIKEMGNLESPSDFAQNLSTNPTEILSSEESISDNNDKEALNDGDQEITLDSSSRKIPVAVVLGLLEQVLNEELIKGDDVKSLIVAKLKERIDWVLSDV